MRKEIIMLGTSFESQGGISTVVNAYREAGLFKRWPIYYIKTHATTGQFEKLLLFFKAFFEFIKKLFLCKVALVHIHTASRNSFWRKTPFIIACLFARIPYIVHLHGAEFMLFFHAESGFIMRKIIRTIFNKASYVVVLSSQWQERVESICGNKNIVVIFNSVIDPCSNCSRFSEEGQSLLFLGAIGRRKGIYELVEAMSIVCKKHPEIVLYCGGTGDISGVECLIKKYNLEGRVKMLGWVGGEAKLVLLKSTMAYVLPSYNEGLPMGILEAMSYGKPVISTPVGGIPDAIDDGVQGFLVKPGSVDDLASVIVKICDDKKMRLEMGVASRRKYEDCFSPDKIIPKIESLYGELGAVPCNKLAAN